MQNTLHRSPALALSALPTPQALTVAWNGGSLLGLLLGSQILTGLVLAMHYTSDLSGAFASVVHIMRDVPGGWALRSLHANGASLFFACIYLHMARGLYYRSYSTHGRVWLGGTMVFLASMGTAFLGYVLPWGQMSYWGATVITNLISAAPVIGPSLVEWVWGGFAVGQPTLGRFFALHFILPFGVAALAMGHLILLHEKGSSDALGSLAPTTKISFHPYFTWKDMVGFCGLAAIAVALVGFAPWLLGDPENFAEASPLVTPVHIQPEWYFLFAYAILRCVPNKLGGVIAMVAAVGVMALLPLASTGRPTAASPLGQVAFFAFSANFFLLTWLGSCPIEAPFEGMSVVASLAYFATVAALLAALYLT